MSSEYSEERDLREQLERSEHELDGLEAELRAVDGELMLLAERNRQYDALTQVCESLERLDSLGASHLFWDENSTAGGTEQRVEYARRQIDDFSAEVAGVEARREAILGRMDAQNQMLDHLHYDLRDFIEQEEARKNEWVVEREANALPHRAQVMPWARGCEEDRRFRKSLAGSLAASLAIVIIVSMVVIPIAQRDTANELPERVAKLVRQERERPPPPPPVEEPIIPEQEPPEPEPRVAEEQPPKEIPESTEKPVVAAIEQPDTREQVKSKGILAFRDSFARRADLRPAAQLGSQARVSSAGEDAVGRPERRMVTTSAPGSSGGINLANISRDVGGGGGKGIEGVDLARVASSIGGGGGGADRPRSGGASAGRTDEEIQIVFDRYKASLYRLYNRELRKDPTLRGQLVLRLTIEADGTVSLCELHSSDMNAPALAQQVVGRVLTFDFGAKQDIAAMTIIYPIDFLPAA